MDGKNQLSGTPSFTPTYDGNGNLWTANYGSAGFTIYSYDDENRLTYVSYEGPNEDCGGTFAGGSPNALLAAEAGLVPDGGEEDFFPFWTSQFKYDGLGRIRERVDSAFDCIASQ